MARREHDAPAPASAGSPPAAAARAGCALERPAAPSTAASAGAYRRVAAAAGSATDRPGARARLLLEGSGRRYLCRRTGCDDGRPSWTDRSARDALVRLGDRFADRADAGRQLGAALAALAGPAGPAGRPARPVLLLGLPQGGVVVAAAAAAGCSGCRCDAIAVRKVGAPTNPELAVGAVTADGTVLLNEQVVRAEELAPTRSSPIASRRRWRRRAPTPTATGATGRPAVAGARRSWSSTTVPRPARRCGRRWPRCAPRAPPGSWSRCRSRRGRPSRCSSARPTPWCACAGRCSSGPSAGRTTTSPTTGTERVVRAARRSG